MYNSNDIKATLKTKTGKFTYFSFAKLEKLGLGSTAHLPFSIKILLESALRNFDNYQVTLDDITRILAWNPNHKSLKEIAFKPGRVILQDFTGVPCVVDLAAMRSAVKKLKGNINKINPLVQCDLIIDHSMQVDYYGTPSAFKKNLDLEFKRNKERYEFLKWGQSAFKNLKVIPPGKGIIHQINLEYLAKGVLKKKSGKEQIVYPDSLVGTDSHTTMINGLGIVGWGVGGIEAEAVMLGCPIYMLLPEVIGFKLTGKLNAGVTATDLVLTVVEMLRKKGVVDKFVEFYGQGINNLSLPDRATVSNMGPEYGATLGIFPIDAETLKYYQLTGRTKEEVDLIERYMKEQKLFYEGNSNHVNYSDTLELDLSNVEPCIAGPKRPQDRIPLSNVKAVVDTNVKENIKSDDKLTNGSVVIASITSCTNTSNPELLICAGLLAKKAIEHGLKVKDFVKTSFIPGSQVTDEYLKAAGVLKYLDALGFNIVGYGCATCIGNSGPLDKKIVDKIKKDNLVVASVLSGNRNFEGRINPHTKLNFLASPPLVVAYALAGNMNIDLTTEAIGTDKKGKKVYLKDIWPSKLEIEALAKKNVKSTQFEKAYKTVFKGTDNWLKIKEKKSEIYKWDAKSTYIQEPPYFISFEKKAGKVEAIKNARVLLKLGDSITTDHISPAGNIAENSAAGKYLLELGVKKDDFNSYGSRRGNDRIMARGTFANIRLKNLLTPNQEGAWTIHFPTGKLMNIYDASQLYSKTRTPLIVLAGKEYGTGSSRDWAAKGPALLGVRAVLAQSFERIHRSNLIGMGVLPLEFKEGLNADTLGLKGDEIFDFEGLTGELKPRHNITVFAKTLEGDMKQFQMTVRLDTPVEIDYYKNQGILPYVLRKMI